MRRIAVRERAYLARCARTLPIHPDTSMAPVKSDASPHVGRFKAAARFALWRRPGAPALGRASFLHGTRGRLPSVSCNRRCPMGNA